jgi:hypothetical protein
LAIFLTNAQAPPVAIQGSGTTPKARRLRVDMTEDEARDMLKDQRAELSPRPIDDPEVRYVSYPELGLALRFARPRVREIAIAQVPRKSFAVD